MDSFNNINNIHNIAATNSYSNIPTVNSLNRDSGNANPGQYTPNPKQTLEGEIVDLKNNDITIRLEDGTKIQAKIYDSSSLNIGQSIRFNVQETANGLVIEHFDAPEVTQNTMIFKALEIANLPANDKNVSIVTELLKNNMSLDKQTILNIQKQSIMNKEISIDTLVLMNKHNIPVSTENAGQFVKYCNYEHRIVKELDTIALEIPELINKVASDKSFSELTSFNTQLINIITDSQKNSMTSFAGEPSIATAYMYPDAPKEVASILSNYHVSDELIQNIKNGTASIRDVASTILKCIEVADELDDYRVSTLNAKNANAFTNIALAKDAFSNSTIQTILDKYASLQRDNSEVASFMNNYNRAQLISKLRDVPGSLDLTSRIWNGDISSNELLTQINKLLSSSGETAVKRLLTSTQYKSIISESLLNNWTISPNDLKKENILENTYRTMYDQLSKLNSFVDEHSPDNNSGNNLMNHFKGTQENIDFMNTLNGLLTYVQVPLKLRNQNIHSDLYVLTNKKNLAKSKNNISVLLHLDMEYLGPMDVNIVMSGNTISTTFNVTDERTKDLIDTNMEQLEYALMEKGFLLNSNVQLKEKTVELIDNFLEKDTPATTLKRYTFDIRT